MKKIQLKNFRSTALKSCLLGQKVQGYGVNIEQWNIVCTLLLCDQKDYFCNWRRFFQEKT